MKIADWMWNRKGAVLAWGALAVVVALIVVFGR
jgi:hypothetical protein